MRALEVAAAQVHGQRHAGGLVRHHLVDEAGVAVRQFVGVVAALARGLAHLVVAQVGQVGVVHLHVAAAGVVQRSAAPRRRPGPRRRRTPGRARGRPPCRCRRGRRGSAASSATGIVTFGVMPAATWRLQVLEVGALDVLDVAHLVGDADHRRRQFLAAVGLADRHRDVGLDAAQLLEEVDVEVGAAELAVGDRLAGPRPAGT